MLNCDEITLRPLASNHLEATREWMNDEKLMAFLGRTKLVDELEHIEWFKTVLSSQDCAFFAIEISSGTHIGNVWLWNIDQLNRKAELRIVIGQFQSQNRGFGEKVIRTLCQYASKTLKLHKIYAYVLSTNPRARHCFKKAGFREEGVLRQDRWSDGQFIDVYFMGILLE